MSRCRACQCLLYNATNAALLKPVFIAAMPHHQPPSTRPAQHVPPFERCIRRVIEACVSILKHQHLLSCAQLLAALSTNPPTSLAALFQELLLQPRPTLAAQFLGLAGFRHPKVRQSACSPRYPTALRVGGQPVPAWHFLIWGFIQPDRNRLNSCSEGRGAPGSTPHTHPWAHGSQWVACSTCAELAEKVTVWQAPE
eukprot:1138687-Pelagomonas_calceolata.AAC.12